MPRREGSFGEANQDGNEQRAQERVRWHHEKNARLPNAAQIHDGDEHENDQADHQRVWL